MTKQSMIDILKDIIHYPISIVIIDGKEYVPLGTVKCLRKWAEQALNKRSDFSDRPKRHYVR